MKYNNVLYVLEKVFVYKKLLKRYYNNFLIKYFKFDKIIELINRKYYWNNIKTEMKLYINIYDVYQRMKMKRYRFYNELNAFSRSLES